MQVDATSQSIGSFPSGSTSQGYKKDRLFLDETACVILSLNVQPVDLDWTSKCLTVSNVSYDLEELINKILGIVQQDGILNRKKGWACAKSAVSELNTLCQKIKDQPNLSRYSEQFNRLKIEHDRFSLDDESPDTTKSPKKKTIESVSTTTTSTDTSVTPSNCLDKNTQNQSFIEQIARLPDIESSEVFNILDQEYTVNELVREILKILSDISYYQGKDRWINAIMVVSSLKKFSAKFEYEIQKRPAGEKKEENEKLFQEIKIFYENFLSTYKNLMISYKNVMNDPGLLKEMSNVETDSLKKDIKEISELFHSHFPDKSLDRRHKHKKTRYGS